MFGLSEGSNDLSLWADTITTTSTLSKIANQEIQELVSLYLYIAGVHWFDRKSLLHQGGESFNIFLDWLFDVKETACFMMSLKPILSIIR